MKAHIWFFALAAVLSVPPMLAQDVQLSDPCHAMTAKSKNFLTFEKFDKELRIALTRQDALALAFLVTFPLRVNDAARGTFSINDAAALKTHFQEVFTPAVRKAILSEKNDNMGCMTEGVMYANGVIWVNASERGYAIWSVNRDAVPPYKMNKWNTLTTKYICQTQTHRIVVDIVTGGDLRYRAWNKPRPLTDSPDLEILKGDGTFEGTNFCAVPIYTFKKGTAIYRIEGGLGCFGDNEPGPPKNATGQLVVTLKDKPAVEAWCY
jgi:hypothetical protein